MNFLKVNWKTTAAGSLALATVAYNWWTKGVLNAEDIYGILVAFGLIAAKDVNVTGGSTYQ